MPTPSLSKIVKAAVSTIHDIQIEIQRQIQSDPHAAFTLFAAQKPLLGIDLIAERIAGSQLLRLLKLNRRNFYYLGEETLGVVEKSEKIDLTEESRLVVLVDMVDGTDLLARGLSNWCSAMVFFEPWAKPGKKIVAAFVGIPDDGVYFATRDAKKASKYRFHIMKDEQRIVSLPKMSSTATNLGDASICFYGQQVRHLTWPIKPRHPFYPALRRLGKKPKTRIYNLAGMPMMMKMLDSGEGLTRIDAVFDVCGQHPHDMVAGAYIAQAAGAVLSDLEGNPIDLEQALLKPAKAKLRYVLTSSKTLAAELRRCLRPD